MNFIWSKYENPVYASENELHINCELTVTTPNFGKIPFTASSEDIMDYGRALYNEIIANADTVPIGPYVPKDIVTNTPPADPGPRIL